MTTLGYSPYNAPSFNNPIYPFDTLFDNHIDLKHQETLDNVDAVVLWGGTDICSQLYNEPKHRFSYGPNYPSTRDIFEWNILREAIRLKKPIIGVCRGAQLICAFAGGKLVQDCTGHGGGSHSITTSDDKHFSVTSSHHQMMFPFKVKYEMLAWSTTNLSREYNGISPEEEMQIEKEPEVVYFPEINAMAIQCHPEWHKADDPFNKWILEKITEIQF
jgi:gamma-glutamyl-gamma-aminobutyrate hydrolase PuuD